MKFTDNVRVCNSIWSKGTGLMFKSRSAVKKEFAYIFPFKKLQRVAITMWFVFFRIDVIFLDEDNKIVDTVKSLRPFSNYVSSVMAKTFIELPNGTISKYLLHKGQKVTWSKKSINFE